MHIIFEHEIERKIFFSFFLPSKAGKKLSTALGREALFESYESRGPEEFFSNVVYNDVCTMKVDILKQKERQNAKF